MKKLFYLFFAFAFLVQSVYAETIYLPTNTSDQYLPTVKIFAYTLSYDGDLIAEAYGSGTLIDDDGIILTNNHVVESYLDPAMTYDAFQVCLTKSNNTEDPVCEFTASVITRDKDRDLALLKMDRKDVRGDSLDFDFYLPYSNAADYQIGDTVTVIGYPDTGGKTITYTSGLISGFSTENNVTYIKTDADISFGNSGGTAVDSEGNFVGIPTYIIGSYSSEVLGYLFPVEDAVSWIDMNKNDETQENEVAMNKLKQEILNYLNANEDGHYVNDYPPYEITLEDGWKFGNALEGAFEGDSEYGYSSYGETLTIYPKNRAETSQMYIEISVVDYPYNVELEDINDIISEYYYSEDEYTLEEVEFNGEYPAIKETSSYVDWWYTDGETIYFEGYHIPYGNQLISVAMSYADSDMDMLDEAQDIIASFEVDLDAVETSVVDEIVSADPLITVKNPITDAYLSDSSYDYDGEHYFSASFGKKDDYDFYISIYSNEYWNEEYIGDFDLFKEDTMADAEEWYDIVAQGGVRIDGHEGFFYTEEYDYGYGDVSYYTYVYIEGDEDTYFSVYYSGDEDSFFANMSDFKKVLKSIEFEEQGEGRYVVPDLISSGTEKSLSDIDNYIYEDSIKNLNRSGAFGDTTPLSFNPAGPLVRKDFILWAVKSMQDLTEFEDFEAGYTGCSEKCFKDVDYSSADAVYFEFAKNRGAIGASDYLSGNVQISLMAALKIIFELYSYEVWQAPDFVPWYVPYLHLGYKNGVIPYGVNDAGYLLSRGEGAYIIDGIMSYGSYYNDYYW